MYAAIAGIILLNLFNAVSLLSGASSLTGFTTDQVNALALFFIDAYNTGFSIALVLFGIHIFMLGYLLFTSRYVPLILGVLLMAASFGYIADSLVNFLLPNVDATIRAVLFVGLIAEFLLALWLLVKGVKVQQTAPTEAR